MESLIAESSLPWVIFALDESKFAVASTCVESMLMTPPHVEVPNVDSTIRGVIQFRNHATPLIDLRARLGMKSRSVEVREFSEMLAAREQDHRNWLTELDASATEGRDFTLATDPHKCAFGKWYDTYEPETYVMKSLLARFDRPHKNIHAIAAKVRNAQQQGDLSEAHRIVHECEDHEFNEMINIFAAVKEQFEREHRETTIVFANNGKFCSIAVDSILTVETIRPFLEEPKQDELLNLSENSIIHSLAKQQRTEDVVFVVNHENLIA